jgi:hypothetical protein
MKELLFGLFKIGFLPTNGVGFAIFFLSTGFAGAFSSPRPVFFPARGRSVAFLYCLQHFFTLRANAAWITALQ